MLSFSAYQMWLVRMLGGDSAVADVMRSAWAWPLMESLHFIGLSMLIGGVATFDLRLLGLGRGIPIAAVHRLIPWGLVGFALTAVTGATFLVTEPDQYIYNPAFQLKILLVILAGLNAATFYLTSYGRILREPDADAPGSARVIAAVSLVLWLAVIASGRLITFYRPGDCGPSGPGVIADCVPG